MSGARGGAASGAGITVRVDDQVVVKSLAELGARLRDMRPIMDEIGAGMVARTVMRFETGTAPGGTPWKPSRRALKESGRTLVLTARLKQSITHIASSDSVQVGSNVEYAAIHQFGGQIERRAYSRKVAFRKVQGTNKAGQSFVRNLFARTRGATPPKRVELKPVTYGASTINMPARPFLGFDDADRADVVSIIRRHVARITGGPAA